MPSDVGESRISSSSFRSSVAFAGSSRLALSSYASASPPMPASPVALTAVRGARNLRPSPWRGACSSRRACQLRPRHRDARVERDLADVRLPRRRWNWRRYSLLSNGVSVATNFQSIQARDLSRPGCPWRGCLPPALCFPFLIVRCIPYAQDLFYFLQRGENRSLTAADPQELQNPLRSPASLLRIRTAGFSSNVPYYASGPVPSQPAGPAPSQPAGPGRARPSSRRPSYNAGSFATFPYAADRRQSGSSQRRRTRRTAAASTTTRTTAKCAPIPGMRAQLQGPARAHAGRHQNERPGEVPDPDVRLPRQGLRSQVRQEPPHADPLQGHHGVRLLPRLRSGGEKTSFNRADVFKRHLIVGARRRAGGAQQPAQEPDAAQPHDDAVRRRGASAAGLGPRGAGGLGGAALADGPLLDLRRRVRVRAGLLRAPRRLRAARRPAGRRAERGHQRDAPGGHRGRQRRARDARAAQPGRPDGAAVKQEAAQADDAEDDDEEERRR